MVDLFVLVVFDFGDFFGGYFYLEDVVVDIKVLYLGFQVGFDFVFVFCVGVNDVLVVGFVVQFCFECGGWIDFFSWGCCILEDVGFCQIDCFICGCVIVEGSYGFQFFLLFLSFS